MVTNFSPDQHAWKGKPTRSTVVWKYAGQWFLPYHVVNSHRFPYYNDLKRPGPFFFHVQYFCVLLAHTTCALFRGTAHQENRGRPDGHAVHQPYHRLLLVWRSNPHGGWLHLAGTGGYRQGQRLRAMTGVSTCGFIMASAQ